MKVGRCLRRAAMVFVYAASLCIALAESVEERSS